MAGLNSNTKLLCHVDGQDGGKEVIDSGSTGHIVTQSGGAELAGNTLARWGSSLQLDGNSDYLTTPDSADWNIITQTTFTIDCWLKTDDYTAAGGHPILSQREDANNHWGLVYEGSNGFGFWFRSGGTYRISMWYYGELFDNDWHHLAIVKSAAGTYGMYVDGTQVGYASDANTDTFTAALTVGYDSAGSYWDGYLDEIRITHSNSFSASPVVGLTDTIAVPTEPHSATGTKLLLHLEDYVDSSSSAHTMTPVGTANIQGRKFGSACMWIDGNNSSYISAPDHADWNIVTQTNFTIDFWLKYITYTGTDAFLSQREDSSNYWYLKHVDGSGFRFEVVSGGSAIVQTPYGGEISDTNWHHIAICKVSDEYGIYVDGTQAVYLSDSSSDSFTGSLIFGQFDSGGFNDCYIDELRITHANDFSASPNSTPDDTITVPTSEHTSNANTKLLLHMDSHDISGDGGSGTYHIPTFEGTAQLDTAEKKFGTASLLLDGNSDYITMPDSDQWDVIGSSTDDWTIDLWVKHALHDSGEYYVEHYEDASNGWAFLHSDGSGLQFTAQTGGGTVIDTGTGGEITDTNWHHVALCKVGDEYACYLDGAQVNYVQDTSTDTYSGLLEIGRDGGGGAGTYFQGHMDEIRVQHSNYFNAAPVVGETDTITVPTAAYDTSPPGGLRRIMMIS